MDQTIPPLDRLLHRRCPAENGFSRNFLAVAVPVLGSVSFLDGWPVVSVTPSVAVPLFRATRPLNGRPVLSVEASVAPPYLEPVRVFHRRPIVAM
jgi:hypothetical protein